jgi:NADH-quinone oxidoreductase subunit I
MSIFRDVFGIAKGMSVTLREMFAKTVVEDYPNKKLPNEGAVFQERFRGLHELQRDENGLEKCVACFLCAAACPSNCIYIEAAENTEENRISGAERYAKVYNIDYNRCIFCGYCVEACPTDAITHGHGFKLATFNASNLVYRKEQLLVQIPCSFPSKNTRKKDRRNRTRSGDRRDRALHAHSLSFFPCDDLSRTKNTQPRAAAIHFLVSLYLCVLRVLCGEINPRSPDDGDHERSPRSPHGFFVGRRIISLAKDCGA